MSQLRLFGSPELEREGQSWPLNAAKTVLLLAYLACKRDWVGRDEVAELIWPEATVSTRLTRLRQMLRFLSAQQWCPDLEVERLRLRWTQGSDVQGLQAAYQSGDWPLVTRLYRGPLLDGIILDEEPSEQWLAKERVHLRALWLGAAKKVAADLEEQGRATEALEVWERILREDPRAEDALCELLRICLACGQFDRGFAAYTVFQQRLHSEFGLETSPTTHAWLDRLRQASTNLPTQADVPTTAPLQDPIPASLFVGRDKELNQLVEWLDSGTSGVFTLFGPGGVGKTRLATEATRLSAGPSVFVPLVSLLKGQSVLAAVAQAMGKPLRAVDTAEEELRVLLRDMRVVLLLDNAEHLIEEVVRLVSLAQEFNQVKVLVTSRVRLNLPSEQAIELGGLELESDSAAESPALSLLFYAVRRSRPGFAWTPYEAEVASRICRVLDGVPLALELAGAWARLFSLSEIARQIEEGLDFLEGSLEAPERHRGLRVVFNHSWQLLSESERKALCRLALFEGGFEVGAGLEVAQVSPQDLLALVDKAMLKIVGETQRRGDVHPLIVEYARERLMPTQREQTLERHAQYFLRLAKEAAPRLRGPDQIEWMERLQLEHPNLRLALRWWTAQEGQAQGALKMASTLHSFFNVRGHYREGLEWLEQSMRLSDSNQHPEEYAEALRCAGAFSTDLGEYPKAKLLLLQSLALCQQLNHPQGIARTQHHLGLLARDQDDLEQSRLYLQQSIAVHRSLGDTDWLATSLNDLAIVHAHQQELAQARAFFEESLTLKEALGDLLGVAYANNNLAVIADMEKKPFAQTLPLYHKSLSIKRQLGDQMGIAATLTNLGQLAWENRDPSARSYLSEALSLFYKIGHRFRTAQVLAIFAQLLADEGQPEKSATLWGFLQNLTEKSGFALNHLLQKTMNHLEENLKQTLGAQRVALAQASGQMLNLEQAIKLTEEP